MFYQYEIDEIIWDEFSNDTLVVFIHDGEEYHYWSNDNGLEVEETN